MRPYDFQLAAVNKAIQYSGEGGRILITSPPGSGKTVMIAEIVRRLLNLGKRILVIAQRREILRQTIAHLNEIDPGLIGSIFPQPQTPVDLSRPVQIASASTLLHRGFAPSTDTVILDEAHHAVATGHVRILNSYPGLPIIGFTATPMRLDGRGLGDIFDKLVVAAVPSELIKRGLLAKPRSFTTPEEFLPDLIGIRRALGDYVPASLEEQVDVPRLVGNVVSHYLQRSAGKTALVFAATVNHSRHLVDRFLAVGVRAEHLDGMMCLRERDAIVGRLRSGVTEVVSSVAVLGEGFDLPRTYAVILARPTMSLALFLQQAGRGLRRYGSRRPLILDHARNILRFGLPEADREFALTNTIEVGTAGRAPVKACRNCHALIASSCTICPECKCSTRESRPMLVEDTDRVLAELTLEERKRLETRLRKFLADRGEESDPAWEGRIVELWTAYRSEGSP